MICKISILTHLKHVQIYVDAHLLSQLITLKAKKWNKNYQILVKQQNSSSILPEVLIFLTHFQLLITKWNLKCKTKSTYMENSLTP